MNEHALQAWQPANLEQAISLAEIVSKSGLVPDALRGKTSDCLLVMMKGRELGLSVMQSLGGIHVIKGKATLSAETMSGLIQASAVCGYWNILESSNEVCRIETQRIGAPKPTIMQFSIEDAKAAGLTSNPNYRNFPAAMLLARCTSRLARAVYPDVIGGVYVDGELDEEPTAANGSAQDLQARLNPSLEVKPDAGNETEARRGLLLNDLRTLCKQRAAQVGETAKAFMLAMLQGYQVETVDGMDEVMLSDAIAALQEAIERHAPVEAAAGGES